MTPSHDPLSGASAPASIPILDGLGAGAGFPAGSLLEALQTARTMAKASATGLSGGALLFELHLDLAAVEIVEAAGCIGALQVTDALREPRDTAARSTGQHLVGRCARAIQEQLDCGFGSPEYLLACTRAALHLDAARRAWPQPEPRRMS